MVEELQKIGITEIKVTEYFKPTSQISLLELMCDQANVENVKRLVHKIGTTGDLADHYFAVKNIDEDDKIFLLNVTGKK